MARLLGTEYGKKRGSQMVSRTFPEKRPLAPGRRLQRKRLPTGGNGRNDFPEKAPAAFVEGAVATEAGFTTP
jgi:hypothetical protein